MANSCLHYFIEHEFLTVINLMNDFLTKFNASSAQLIHNIDPIQQSLKNQFYIAMIDLLNYHLGYTKFRSNLARSKIKHFIKRYNLIIYHDYFKLIINRLQ